MHQPFRNILECHVFPLIALADLLGQNRNILAPRLLRRGLASDGFLTAASGIKSQDFGVVDVSGAERSTNGGDLGA
jgi:hypothetical protein